MTSKTSPSAVVISILTVSLTKSVYIMLGQRNPSFLRLPSFVTIQFHANRSNTTFDTTAGENITTGLNQLAEAFDLPFFFGTSPRDFTLTRLVLLS